MTAGSVKKIIWLAGGLLGAWLAARYLLPVSIPFLIGGGLALMAEPGVATVQKRWRWRRFPAVMLCLSLTLALLITLIGVIGAVAVKELGLLAQHAPKIAETVGQGMTVLEDFLVTLADRAPENIRPVVIRGVVDTFQGGNALLEQVTGKLPGVVAGAVGKLSKGALTVGTGILAGYMLCVRLPAIRSWLQERLPKGWTEKLLPTLKRAKYTFGCWLKAQLKLMLLTWLTVGLGLTVIGVPYGLLWAIPVAMVDAVPIFGTGTVLVPWALVSFLQGQPDRGGGLMAIYGIASLVRSIAEPRLVGRSLGLDPLVSLVAVYAGFRLWGIPGLILAPVTAALVKSLVQNNSQIIHKEKA